MDIVVEDIVERLDSTASVSVTNSTDAAPLEQPSEILLAVGTAVVLGIIILSTIFGNVLVILSVFTARSLRSVQNMFIVSLAAADIAVAVLVMPLNVAYTLTDRWSFGLPVCKMWLTADVLCCTASILNLCGIALDRYWAIHDPINYARKRTLQRVMGMIAAVWLVSFLISAPPLFGWNDWPEKFTDDTPCMLTEEKGYVVYSSMGSFYIPLFIMTVVYAKIFEAARSRIRSKAKAAAQLAAMRRSPDAVSSTIPLRSIQTDVSTAAATDESTSSSARAGSDEKPDEKHQPAPATLAVPETVLKPKGPRTLVAGANPGLRVTVRHLMREKQKICLQKERRAAQVLGIVMGVFVLCWLPFFLMYLVMPFCEACRVSDRVANIVVWLGYANSALNPVIYTVFNMDFRRAFLQLLCRRRR